MKKLTSKLLLSALALTCSAFAMDTQIQPEVQAMQAIYFSEPNKTDFKKAKELINAIPADRINEVDTFVNGNILYLINTRYKQFNDDRYLELRKLLESRGAIEKEYKTVYYHNESGKVLEVDAETGKVLTSKELPAGTYTDSRTGRKIDFEPSTQTITAHYREKL